jgi:uncharacterized protein DUF6365
MRILVFGLSTVAFGDTLVGVGLTNQLRDAGIDAHYVITHATEALVKHHGYPYTLVDPGADHDVRGVIDRVVREFRPDAFVLAEYLNYWGTLVRGFGVDPWFLDEYQLPVLPIDVWEWENTSFRFDVCGREHEREVSRRILDLPAHLRPVPVCHLGAGAAGRGFPYRILAPEEPLPAAARQAVRAGLGVREQDKLVMVPLAPWQQPARNDPGITEMTHRLATRVPGLLASYLEQLPRSTHFLFIGHHVPEAFRALPADRLHILPLCPPERYDALLASADALLSLNATQVTMIRAMLRDIPALLITNRFAVPDAGAVDAVGQELGGFGPHVGSWLRDTAPIAPFRMWPKGLHAFMEPVLSDNPYTDAILHRELLDEDGVVTGLTALLHDPATRDRLAGRQAGYVSAIDALPPAPEVFESAFRRAGLGTPAP